MVHADTVVAMALLLIFSNFGEINAQCSPTNPCVEELGQGKPFQEPVQLFSSDGSWTIDLTVDIGDLEYGWLKLKRRMYNGRPVGPTWNVKKGDKIRLNLINSLSDLNNHQSKPPNRMDHPNTTNMHTHGLHISADDPQDNVLIAIEPGETYTYNYQLHEKNPSGTLWYHAHVHASTMFQVHSGMSGMLIVQDEIRKMPWQLKAASCPFNCDRDIQMVFQPLLQYVGFLGFARLQEEIGDDPYFRHDNIITESGETLAEWLQANVNLVTVNGILEPVLNMDLKKMYRFRMVNGAGFDALEVFITKEGTTEAARECDIREIAVDGVYLDRPRKMHDGQTLLAPGQRTDWLVRCNRRGTYELRSFPNPEQRLSVGSIDRWSGLLVTLKVDRLDTVGPPSPGSQPCWRGPGGGRGPGRRGGGCPPQRRDGFRWKTPFPTRLPHRPPFVRDMRQLKEEDITQRNVVEFNTRLQLNRLSWTTADNFRYAMTVNEPQEWHIVNTDNSDSHPFHLHVNHFQVIGFNKYTGGFSIRFEEDYVLYDQDTKEPCFYQRAGLDEVFAEEVPADALEFLGHEERYKADAGNTLGYARVGDWRDTLLVPPLSNITIRFIPDRYTGVTVIHCHILGHEDAGMMMVTKIVDIGEPLEANITSGEIYPGTCRKCDRYPFNNPQTICELSEIIESVEALAADTRRILTPPRDQSRNIPDLWTHKIRPRGKGTRVGYSQPVLVAKANNPESTNS